MKKRTAIKLFAVAMLFSALRSGHSQSSIPTSYQGAVVYDLTAKIAGTGAAYKATTLTGVFGVKRFDLDLTGFVGVTNHRLPMLAVTLGKTFPVANQVNAYFGIGGDQIQGMPTHPCAQAGINWAFSG